MSLTQPAPRQHADAPQFSTERLKAFIETRLRRGEDPARIAAGVYVVFGLKIDPDQVVPYWKGEIALPAQTAHRQDADEIALPTQTEHRQDADECAFPTQTEPRQGVDESALATQTERRQDADEIALATQTEHRPDKESVQFAADEAPEPLYSRMAEVESSAQAPFSFAPATQTGHRQDDDALQIPADPVDEPEVSREEHAEAIDALEALVRANYGLPPRAPEDSGPVEEADAAPAEDASTQTGRRQEPKTKSILTEEVKAFIVRGLARYETPTRVAASVKLQFGIAIDRRQVYAYDPAGSRRPAQCWIDLHAATRAKFLDAVSEIGIAQKVVRLRMLDRFANLADEANQTVRAAAFLAQAAKECGGFYERYARPKPAAALAA